MRLPNSCSPRRCARYRSFSSLEALFNRLHNLTDPAEVVRISAEHEVNFLPPDAND
jgi:hypothetical protein